RVRPSPFLLNPPGGLSSPETIAALSQVPSIGYTVLRFISRRVDPGPVGLARRMRAVRDGERSLAIFIDFENLALGFQNRRERFDITRVLERIVEKGKIVANKAYADWSRFATHTTPLHRAAIELIEIPRRGQSGKNSADIRLCVDAMDLAYSKEHINTFVVVSG